MRVSGATTAHAGMVFLCTPMAAVMKVDGWMISGMARSAGVLDVVDRLVLLDVVVWYYWMLGTIEPGLLHAMLEGGQRNSSHCHREYSSSQMAPNTRVSGCMARRCVGSAHVFELIVASVPIGKANCLLPPNRKERAWLSCRRGPDSEACLRTGK